MNAIFPRPETRTLHLFTHEEVLKLIAEGVVDKRVVLLDGGIYHMPSDGYAHTNFAMKIAREAHRGLDPAQFFVGVQTTLLLGRSNAPSPDVYILAGDLPNGPVPAERIVLVIEVADTSLKDDLTDSAGRYARHNVRELWVVDVNARETHIHTHPQDGAYQNIRIAAAEEKLSTPLAPGFTVRLADI
jgi:Uma2 family endonuclease